MPDSGRILLDGAEMSSAGAVVGPHKRNLGMVFQNYALWPHVTVAENVGYPPKLRRVPDNEAMAQIRRARDFVGLPGMEDRTPDRLSGGQQQRVALARALVMQPGALLLDEPLSNLDARLRKRMRFEIMDLHRKLGLTIVYVTHDQGEAMAMSDRIVLMRDQKVAQVGTARELYRAPIDAFVAEFVGTANLVPCRVVAADGGILRVRLDLGPVPAVEHECRIADGARVEAGETGFFFARPESLAVVAESGTPIAGKVGPVTFLGDALDVRVRSGNVEWRVKTNADSSVTEGARVSVAVRDALFVR